MSRTKGARDKKKRKQRKFYAGKPIKKKRKRHGRLVPYISKRDRRGKVKIWWWEVRKMSLSGFRNWSRSTRMYAKRIVYKPLIRADVFPYELSNKESIGQLAIDHLGYEGTFLLKMFCHAKNRYGCTNRKVAVVKIRDTPEGLKAFVSDTWKISIYWFWEK